MSEGGRRIAIGIDESDFAEQAFNCKYLPFSRPYVVYHVSIKKVVDKDRKKSLSLSKLLERCGRVRRCYKNQPRIESFMCMI